MARQGILFIWCLLLVMALPNREQAEREQLYRGQIEWGALCRPGIRNGDRHAESDPRLLLFVRDNTTLNIDTEWHSADVESLRQMIAYPIPFFGRDSVCQG